MEKMSGVDGNRIIGENFFNICKPNDEFFRDYVTDIMRGTENSIEKRKCHLTIGKPLLVNLSMNALVGGFSFSDDILITLSSVSEHYEQEMEMTRRLELANLKALSAQKQMALNEKKILIMHEISEMLRDLLPLEEKLHIILTALTAGEGLEYNRAALFLVNDEKQTLEGRMGIGATSHTEAKKIWDEVVTKDKNIYDFVKAFNDIRGSKKSSFDLLIRGISIPMSPQVGVPVSTLFEKKPVVLSCDVLEGRAVSREVTNLVFNKQPAEFASVPLIVKDKVIGVILVDNIYTEKPICEDNLKTLMIFANQVAVALENSRLYDGLHQKMDDLAQAHKELDDAHKCISRYDVLASLGRVAAGVAHEIRNPLNSMSLNLQLLQEDIQEAQLKDKKSSMTLVQVIKDEIERLDDLVKEFTSYAKPSNMDFREVNLNQLINQVLRLVKYSESRHNIRIDRHISPKVIYIMADADQIKQALLNIILNAIQAMTDGGRLCVSESYAVQDVFDRVIKGSVREEKNNMVCVKIEDTGKGMDPSVLKRVFEPFFTTKSDGIGLGLSIVERIINEHGGYIGVDSLAERGTTFKIFLPLSDNKANFDRV